MILFDIKTAGAIYNSYWLQLAAYRQLLLKELNINVDGVAILWLKAKTRTKGTAKQIQGENWQLISLFDVEEMDKNYRLFKATHSLWLEENGSMLPKQFSYQITHKL